jgi:hypothetical protein
MGYCILESQKELPGQFRDPAGFRDTLKTSVQLLSMSWGNVNDHWKAAGLGLVALVVFTLFVLLLEWFARPAERGRTFGLWLFLASALVLLFGMGRARGVFPEPRGLQNHYVPHVVAIPIAIYLTFCKLGATGVRHVVQLGLMVVMLAMLPRNIQQGLQMGDRIQAGSAAFERDILAGKPPAVLAERHARFFFDLEAGAYREWEENLANHIRGLQQAKIGIFREVKDPAFRSVTIPLDPIDILNATWQDGVFRARDASAFITFALPKPTFVLGVRLRYSYRNPNLPDVNPDHVMFRAAWKLGDQAFSEMERTDRIEFDPNIQTWGRTWTGEGKIIVWVNDTIDGLRLYPLDKAGVFQLQEVALLLPMAEYSLAKRIYTAAPEAELFLGDGWHDTDGNARSTATKAIIAFQLAAAKSLRFRMRATPFGDQRLIVRVNGHDLADHELTGNHAETIEIDIPKEVLSDRNEIAIITPRARSPRSIDGSDDDRVLGMAIEWWELVPPQ